MKKIFILIFTVFILTACGKDFKEAGSIMDGYVDTLEGSVSDAKDIKIIMESGQGDLQNQINAIKK